MFNLIAQAGYANATVNFTDDFSLLIAGLIGFVWLSVGMLVAAAVHDWISQGTRSTTQATPYVNEYRHAA
jgi:hypothetical protein